MSLKEVLEQHKMHKVMNTYLQGLSNEMVEDYSLLYCSDFTRAKESQKSAQILFKLIDDTKKSNNVKAFVELKNVVDTYGKWKRVTNCGVTANAPSKICLALPKAVQSKLISMYNASRHSSTEITR